MDFFSFEKWRFISVSYGFVLVQKFPILIFIFGCEMFFDFWNAIIMVFFFKKGLLLFNNFGGQFVNFRNDLIIID